jgi:phosphate transport system permease protein
MISPLAPWATASIGKPKPQRKILRRLIAPGSTVIAMLALVPFAWLICDLLARGFSAVDWAFLSTAPLRSGRSGGIAPILLSTSLIVSVALFAALPLALLSALWMTEPEHRDRRSVRGIRGALDVLAGMPSVVFGLFGNLLFSQWFGLGYSILAGGLTLACMILPLLTRVSEEILLAIPLDLRASAAAAGLTRISTVRSIILPLAAPGLIGATVLGLGRALAETAALIFTSGYVDRYPRSLLDSGRSLSVHIYDLAMNVPGGDRNAAASALVLLMMMALLSFLIRILILALFRSPSEAQPQ